MRWLDAAVHEIRLALRGLWRRPAFSVAVVLTLALGIGSNAVVFGVVDRLLLTPPQHIDEPETVRLLYEAREDAQGSESFSDIFTYPGYADLLDRSTVAGVAAYAGPSDWTLGSGTTARRVRVQQATVSLFSVLRTTPALGRFFDDGTRGPGAVPSAVLSDGFWSREFGRAPDVIGRVLDLDEGRFEVVGVAPAGFTGPTLAPVDVWVPLESSQTLRAGRGWIDNRDWYWLRIVVRLAPSMSPEAAGAQLTAVRQASLQAASENGADGRVANLPRLIAAPLIAARGPEPSLTASVSLWLSGVSLAVLLIACANVANLLLARSARSMRGNAIRIAVGIGRARLAGHVFIETGLLTVLAAAAALIAAQLSAGAVHGILIPGVSFEDPQLMTRMVLFTGVAAVAATLLAGVLPALHARRLSGAGAFRWTAAQPPLGASRLQGALMVGQAALSVLLLIGAGLFIRSFERASEVDLGFDAERVVAVRLEFTPGTQRDRATQLYRSALLRAESIPGVSVAALSGGTTPFYSAMSGRLSVPGRDSLPEFSEGPPYQYAGTFGILETLGARVTRGRGFDRRDTGPGAEPVILLSRALARAIWPQGDPLGRCVMLGDRGEDNTSGEPCRRVIGIYASMARFSLSDPSAPSFAYPIVPEDQRRPWVLLLRTPRDDPGRVIPAVRSALGQVSPEVRFVDARPMRARLARHLRPWTLGASMFAALGVLALAVASLGLFSLMSYIVAGRRREMGIRGALGAQSTHIVALILRRAMRYVGVGIALGVGAALVFARQATELMFETNPRDPVIYGAVALVVAVTGLVAAAAPAVQAVRVDPNQVLRDE